MIMAVPNIGDELHELHDTYVWKVNAAVEGDDEEQVERLANEYTERALRVITAPRAAS
jgi:hypothetical protein